MVLPLGSAGQFPPRAIVVWAKVDGMHMESELHKCGFKKEKWIARVNGRSTYHSFQFCVGYTSFTVCFLF